jgi:hypothetical protein
VSITSSSLTIVHNYFCGPPALGTSLYIHSYNNNCLPSHLYILTASSIASVDVYFLYEEEEEEVLYSELFSWPMGMEETPSASPNLFGRGEHRAVEIVETHAIAMGMRSAFLRL